MQAHYPILYQRACAAAPEVLDLLSQLSEVTDVGIDLSKSTVLEVIQQCFLDPITRKRIKINPYHLGRVLRGPDEVTLMTKYGKTSGPVRQLCEELIKLAGKARGMEEGKQILTLMKAARI